ncbi:hypothetical protein HZ326_2953 [Fusarium oxysporum f. sp. albedinis]|nr:hypothetical protein HZ326_2953 [Fusarium oxysporum f. sp. albedinis]
MPRPDAEVKTLNACTSFPLISPRENHESRPYKTGLVLRCLFDQDSLVRNRCTQPLTPPHGLGCHLRRTRHSLGRIA